MPAPEYFDPCDDLYEQAISTPGLKPNQQMDLYADLIDRKIGRRTLYLVQREEPEDLIA